MILKGKKCTSGCCDDKAYFKPERSDLQLDRCPTSDSPLVLGPWQEYLYFM